MKRKLFIALFFSFIAAAAYSQQQTTTINGYMVPVCVYKGDTIPAVQLPNVYIFRPLKFKNEKERREYYRLVRNVKKTLPLAREINRAVIETYEYIETLPDKKAREKHLKLVEKGLKEQYTPIMKMKKVRFNGILTLRSFPNYVKIPSISIQQLKSNWNVFHFSLTNW